MSSWTWDWQALSSSAVQKYGWNVLDRRFKSSSLPFHGSNGDPALVAASRAGHIEVVEYLGDKGASLDLEGSDGDRALVAASKRGHIKIVKYLGDKGVLISKVCSHTSLKREA
ncbi:hypothetical protein BU17DRAFT_100710 [Hysterangium stoloniferum]|nr:hypothetical protein BU17DRAFT_100710 [Hysterangium stoloniferum]